MGKGRFKKIRAEEAEESQEKINEQKMNFVLVAAVFWFIFFLVLRFTFLRRSVKQGINATGISYLGSLFTFLLTYFFLENILGLSREDYLLELFGFYFIDTAFYAVVFLVEVIQITIKSSFRREEKEEVETTGQRSLRGLYVALILELWTLVYIYVVRPVGFVNQPFGRFMIILLSVGLIVTITMIGLLRKQKRQDV